MRRVVLLAVAALVPWAYACDDSETDPQPPPSEVTVQTTANNTFNPPTLELAVGGKVTWVFGATAHNVTFEDIPGRPLNIPLLSNTTEFRVFATAGTFLYSCTEHPGMEGTIIVR